jgi:hypothetical protein
MKIARLPALLAVLLPIACYANDFPTTDRVEYVLECMSKHPGKQEYLYKCSCEIDKIAASIKYDEYVEMSTALRYRDMGGERGAMFRDPDNVKNAAKKYSSIQVNARKACGVS